MISELDIIPISYDMYCIDQRALDYVECMKKTVKGHSRNNCIIYFYDWSKVCCVSCPCSHDEPPAGAAGRQGASDDVGEVGPLKSDWVEVVEVVHEWCWEKMGDKRK